MALLYRLKTARSGVHGAVRLGVADCVRGVRFSSEACTIRMPTKVAWYE